MGIIKKEKSPKKTANILRFSPAVIFVGYVSVSVIWLAATDILVQVLFADHAEHIAVQFLKGLFYISTTGFLVYWLARKAYASIDLEMKHERFQMSERFLSAVLASIGEAVLLIDPGERTIVNCNEAAEKIFGYEKEELKGRKTEILHVDREHFENFGLMSEPVLDRGGVYRTEYRMKRKDGSLFFTANTVSPTHATLGWKAEVVSVVRDITETREKEERIFEEQKKLEKALRERETLMQEVHHRVKNNLNVMVSLLNLQSNEINSVEKARKALKESSNRIYSMALVHESMYKTHNLSEVRMDNYLRSMVDQLKSSTNHSKMVEYHLSLDEVLLDITTAIPCGIILNELIVNAQEHAFKEQEGGRIDILLKQKDDVTVEIGMKDNGVGLPDGFVLEKASSLGFNLVKVLIDQINGSIQYDYNEGAVFTLSIPSH